MRHLLRMGMPIMAALLLWEPGPAAAQSQKAPDKADRTRRMADGHPDLQGTYDIATLTPVDRPIGAPAVYTREEAQKREAAAAKQRAKGDEAIQGDRTAPPKGGDGSVGAAGNVGGYNTGWLDVGSAFTVVDGEKRASILVDPADGRVPPLVDGARGRFAGA